MCLLLLFLPALAFGCGRNYVASYPEPPPPQIPQQQARQRPLQPAPQQAQRPIQKQARQPAQRAYSGGPAEVVEKSQGYLGGPRNITHEVGPLETVWRIARMYDVTPESIYKANGLRSGDALRIGQKLLIPNARMIRHVINLYPSGQWKYIIVHHTATGRGNARTINLSHGDRGFWNGLGYHFLIDNGTLGKGDGQIEMSPRWIRQQCGAHCKASGMNDMAIGIALVGNFNQETPTQNQLRSLSLLLSTLRNYYGIPAANTHGHREVAGAKTECPGRAFPLGSLRQSAR